MNTFEIFWLRLNSARSSLFAVLIDPDKFNPKLIDYSLKCKVDCFLVGGSKINSGNISLTIKKIKSISDTPVIIFPGDEKQLTPEADGLFLPSLLSGNNSEYLIGKQILMAPLIRKMKLAFVPMAYLLIDGGKKSSTQKVTQTSPLKISATKKIIHTCIAAEQLGFKILYLEAGSGAKSGIPAGLIKKVKREINLPLIVGGGIDSKRKLLKAKNAGANMIVVGNALEKNPDLIFELAEVFARHKH